MKSLNVLPFFGDPGEFFGGCEIGEKDAPSFMVDGEQPQYQYHAVVTKNVGQVSWEDFLRYARRLIAICYRAYRLAEWELIVDSRGPISFRVCSNWKDDKTPYFTTHFSQLNEKVFMTMFKASYIMKLRISQKAISGRRPSSYAKIFWHCLKPDTLFIAARRYDRDDYLGTAARAEELLFRKLLFVKGMALTDGFTADLGMDAYNKKEMELPS